MIPNDTIIEAKADKFRSDCGLENDNAIDFDKLLLSLDLLTVFRPLNGNFSGMALKTNNNLFMLVNTTNQLGRQHFTIAHELYHLFVQENFTFQMCKAGSFDKKNREEYNADVFSSCLIMPKAGIMKLIPEKEVVRGGNISLATILKLEQYFGVSRRALLVRLSRIDFIKYKDYEKYLTNIRKSAIEYGYTDTLYQPTNDKKVVGNYGIKAKELFDSDNISESHYHSLMFAIGIDVVTKLEENDKEI